MSAKGFLKTTFRSFLALAGLLWLYPGFVIEGGKQNLVLAAVVLTVINTLVRPLLKLLLLPINIISFGLFRWVINVLSLLLLTFVVDQVKFIGFVFPGLNQYGVILPQINFSPLGSLIVGSFLLTLIRKVNLWFLQSDD